MILMLCTASINAFAACSNNEDGNPGQNGEIEYFSDNTLKYCDDSNWWLMCHRNSCSLADTCSNPGEYYYDFSTDAMVWCDGTTLWNIGTSRCSLEGAMRYKTDHYEFCDGMVGLNFKAPEMKLYLCFKTF